MNVNHLSDDARNLNWLVANFTSKVPGVANTLVQTISDGSILSVLTTTDADLGLIGYEMALLVSRVGDVLTPALRVELQAALPS